jgi:uncharacterized protein (DUF1330 family)
MAAYLIFLRESEIRDADAMTRYQEGNRKGGGPSHGMKPLIIYGQTEALEGDAPDGVVVLEFPDAAAARAWYDDPGYQSRIPDRMLAADYRAMLVEGWAPPSAA